MQNRNKLLVFLFVVAVGGWLIYRQMQQFKEFSDQLDALKKEMVSAPLDLSPAVLAGELHKNWGVIQAELKDSVVQIFSEIAEFNWLEPYKSPNQMGASGSGFFINEQGEMITNAHVVDQAKAVSIQIPTFGKRRFDVDVVGVSADRDLALVRMKPTELKEIKAVLGKIPVMCLGNSDQVHRSDEIMALGYPLGQQGLKSTTGVVSGREHINGQHMIQISAPINPGSSGGPSINFAGQVVGVNSAGVVGAQNVGYIIPSNEVALFLHQLKQMPSVVGKVKFLRKPFLGVLYNPASDTLAAFLGDPVPGGLYVAGAQKNSPLEKAGVLAGDMIYEIDGHRLDTFGEMSVPWSEDKVSVVDYIARLMIGNKVNLLLYRQGKERNVTLTFSESELAPIRRMFPGYEKIDYENLGGLVVMPLAINHLPLLIQVAPELTQYIETQNQIDGAVIITHVFPTSEVSRSRTIGMGAVIKELNGVPVKTLDEFRVALKKSLDTKFLTIKTSQNIFAVLAFDKILDEESKLAQNYVYPVTPFTQELIAAAQKKGLIKNNEKQKAA